MLKALFGRIWPYIAVVGAVLASLFAVRQSGKAAARNEQAAKINKQAEKAREVVRNVDNEIGALDDDAIRDRAKQWVRRDD